MSLMKKTSALIFLFSFIFILLNLAKSETFSDIINATQTLKDGDILKSANGTFELGFFSPGSSTLRYLSIRYNNIPEKSFAWIGNRQLGINGSAGVLRLTEDGILVLNDGDNTTSVWSSNTTIVALDPVAQLLDTGNLVVRNRDDNNSENYLWQSFDYPGDTGLTGVKFGLNKKTGLDRSLTSWKTSDDPSRGNYTYGIVITGLPQIVLRNSSAIRYRSGPWNGRQFSGAPYTRSDSSDNITYVSTEEEVYVISTVRNSSILTRLYLNPQGHIEWYIWTGTWLNNIKGGMDVCDIYRTCGANGICDKNNLTICSCLNGFEPKDKQEWKLRTWTGGCARKNKLNCSSDWFQKVSGVKVPETKNFWYNETMNLEDCGRLCLKNCSCKAYGNLKVTEGGSGCLQWFGDLIDMKSFPSSEQNIYIRLSALERAAPKNTNSSKTVRIAVGVSFSVAALVIGVLTYVIWRRKHQKNGTPSFRL
ncbi:hypothetical protein ACFE04_013312 [Oxalis oulophora]